MSLTVTIKEINVQYYLQKVFFKNYNIITLELIISSHNTSCKVSQCTILYCTFV